MSRLNVIHFYIFALLIFLANSAIEAGIPRVGSCDQLREADEMWRSGQFHDSHTIYKALAGDSKLDAVDRVGAYQRLALQAWLTSGSSESTLDLLNDALSIGIAIASTQAMRSRFLRLGGLVDSAIYVSRHALSESRTFFDSLQASLALASAVFEREKDKQVRGLSKDFGALDEAMDALASVKLGGPAAALRWEGMLGLWLLLRDRPNKDDTFLATLMAEPGSRAYRLADNPPFVSAREGAPPDRFAEPDARKEMVQAMASSGLFKLAQMEAMTADPSDGEDLTTDAAIEDIVDYAEFVDATGDCISRIYRKRLSQDSTIETEIQELIGLAHAYWLSLDYAGERPEFTLDELGTQLARRWGARFCAVDFDPDNFSVIWGHVVREDERTIEQYGHSLKTRFAAIDQMVSSGWMEWLTDGEAPQIGGWTPTHEAVYWIRPAWGESSIRAWERVTYPDKIARVEKQVVQLKSVDDSLLHADPYANIPGASLRLSNQSLEELRDSLRRAGHSGNDLREAFMNQYWYITYESNLVAHEGRHALDMFYYGDRFETWNATQVELRAKLSEVVFSPDPMFTATNSIVIFYTSGSGEGHGAASALIRRHLVDWMNAHASEIRGFDTTEAPLPQLDLLSRDQLVAAITELDPMVAAKN
jgi:hypothetical protein